MRGCDKAVEILQKPEGAQDISTEALGTALHLIVDTIAANVCASRQKDAEVDFLVQSLNSDSFGMRQLAVLVLSVVIVKSDAGGFCVFVQWHCRI